jgi:murein DD-endopeptidase MepM/ murein hydrolase activator NlpD
MSNPWYMYPISHGFYPKYDPSVFDTPHYAVDISTPQDTPITAFKSGVVKQEDYAYWGGKAGGGEVFVQPDDGSSEYYFYHLDNINVKTGQHVSAGDQVGLSGGQNSGGSHPTDPAWSTGPHLHVGYFSNFINTPVGTRPYGPDITGEITLLKGGGIQSSENQMVSHTSVPSFSIARAGTGIGLFLLALSIIVGGVFFIFPTTLSNAKSAIKSFTKGSVNES